MADSMAKSLKCLVLSSLVTSGVALSVQSSTGRRCFLASTAATFGLPGAAMAVQERNEALCGTGFFTNIYEYKCTGVGDISDEGASKELSETEQGSVDSLMSKFGGVDVLEDEPAAKSKSSDTKSDTSK